MEEIVRQEIDKLQPYEPGKPISEVKRELGLTDVIKLASNESPYPPFPEALEAIEGELEEINRYPDGSCFLLKKELASFLDVDEKNITIGHGSNELERLIANVVLRPGDEAIMASPSFVVYPTVVEIMNATPIEIPLKNYKHDLEAMLNAISEKTRLVFICSPNNPTGTIVEKDELNEFLKAVPEGVVVVIDEAYSEFVESQNYPNGLDYLRQDKLVAVFRTFSKIYSLAGLRIGYGMLPEFLVTAMDKVREPFNVNSLAQAAALASLKCQDEVEKRRKLNWQGKNYLYAELKKIGLECVPSEANFVLVNVKKNSREVFKDLLKEGVIIRTGDIFGESYQNFIRVTIGTQEENQLFVQTLRKVLKI